jgi:hypothetical protein
MLPRLAPTLRPIRSRLIVKTERAYVLLSHQTRLRGHQVSEILKRAINWETSQGVPPRTEAWITIETQNHGRTPADVLGGGLWLQVAPDRYPPPVPQPEFPPHYPIKLDPCFVVPSTHVETTSMMWLTTDLTRIQKGNDILWIVGFVDYVDRFGNRHRAGYGRRYVDHGGPNRLVFDETTTALNYDRPLTPEQTARRPSA